MVLARLAYRTVFAVTLGIAILFLNALPLAVHSQSPEDPVAPEVASSTPVATNTNDWFKTEQLYGENMQSGDFVISPGKVELEISPGESVVRYISVSNRVSDNRRFNLTVEDVAGSADGSSAITLLGNDRGPYSVKDMISFPHDSFEIGLGKLAKIPVTVTVPADAEPGGYYGAVLVSTVRIGEEDGGEGNTLVSSPIIARVGSLFFVTVPGNVKHEGKLRDFTTIDDNLWYESGPIRFGITYENSGSIHLNPYGEIHITNMLGEEVGFQEIEPWFTLPKSVRTRDVNWNRELLLGRYTATIKLNRGYDDIVDEMTISFWVLPWKIMVGVFVGIFLVFFLFRAFFRTFEFRRKS